MRYEITIRGSPPGIIHHDGAKGLDPSNPQKAEADDIKKRRGTNRTESDNQRLRELDCQVALWIDESGAVGIPARAIQACLENAARKFKEGPAVREGVIITDSKFGYDEARYGSTLDELGKSTQFTVPVVIGRNRVLATRARFEDWTCTFVADCDPELVDSEKMLRWLDMAGRRVGLGDWRPSSPKGGQHGRFTVEEITDLDTS